MAGIPRKLKELSDKANLSMSDALDQVSSSEFGRQPRFKNFLCVLYPDCESHVNMMSYLESHSYLFRYVAILHDLDVWEDDFEGEKNEDGTWKKEPHFKGDLKKPHWHVLIVAQTQYTKASFTKFFHIWESHFEVCNSVVSTLAYFLHETPDSMHKHHYSSDLLFGDLNIASQVKVNASLLQLRSSLYNLVSHRGDLCSTLIDALDSKDAEFQISNMMRYQNFLTTVARQRAFKKENK